MPLLKPLPHLQPFHKRLSQRKAVTIITGFNCLDGIVMCADTEEWIATHTRTSTDKLKTVQLSDDGGWMICGGAGDTGLIEFTVNKLARTLWDASDWNVLEEELNRKARDIFRNHIRVYAGMPEDMVPDLAFMIAVQINRETRLFKWERNYVVPVHLYEHDSVGVGSYQAMPLLRELALSSSCEQMVFYAVRLMKKVKSLVPGCGGDTDVMTLKRDGSVDRYKRAFIQEVERFSLDLDRFLVIGPMLEVTSPRHTSEDATNVALADSFETLKKLAKRYRAIEPSSVSISKPRSRPQQ
jgi:20S proteasome alpha/beta subunit